MIVSRWVFIVVLAVLAGAMPPAHAATEDGTTAWFEGRTIDLGHDWEGATVCVDHDQGINCYRTESAAQDAVDGLTSTCSSPLKLYDGANYTGTSYWVARRGVPVNLTTFDHRTSSFKVGACGSQLAAGSNMGGGIYGGRTWPAGTNHSRMASGWDNAISSVYLT